MAAAFSHVIFDLDGTILNTLEDLAAAGNHTCEMHGWPTFAVDEYRYKVGNGMLKLVERFMPAEYAGDGRMFEQTLAEGARPVVRVRTGWGSTRILDMLVGEQLPRIC